LAAIVALSAYLPLEGSLDAEASPANRATPIFMGHGTQDPVVPLQLAQASKAALERRGYEIEWHTWPMGHNVHPEEIGAIAAFLARALGDGKKASRSSILLPGD
ncbi:MAG: alpha/beta hydrolase, partial [Usitatibacter sp.]